MTRATSTRSCTATTASPDGPRLAGSIAAQPDACRVRRRTQRAAPASRRVSRRRPRCAAGEQRLGAAPTGARVDDPASHGNARNPPRASMPNCTATHPARAPLIPFDTRLESTTPSRIWSSRVVPPSTQCPSAGRCRTVCSGSSSPEPTPMTCSTTSSTTPPSRSHPSPPGSDELTDITGPQTQTPVSSRREVFSRAELTADLSVRKLSPAANEVRPTGGSVEVSGRPGYPRRRGLDRDSVAWCTAVRPGRT